MMPLSCPFYGVIPYSVVQRSGMISAIDASVRRDVKRGEK